METRCGRSISNRAIHRLSAECAFEVWFEFDVCEAWGERWLQRSDVHKRQFLRSKRTMLCETETKSLRKPIDAIHIRSVQHEAGRKRFLKCDCRAKRSRAGNARRCGVLFALRFSQATQLKRWGQLRGTRQVNKLLICGISLFTCFLVFVFFYTHDSKRKFNLHSILWLSLSVCLFPKKNKTKNKFFQVEKTKVKFIENIPY